MACVLVVDDDSHFCDSVDRLLREHGHRTETVYSGHAALSSIRRSRADLVLLDVQMDGMDGLQTLRRLRQVKPDLPVVMVTGHHDMDTAVTAMKGGAMDFITKPLDAQRLLDTIQWLLSTPASKGLAPAGLVGQSRVFTEAMSLLSRFAIPDINVLLRGETGTGKELFARRLHDMSKRSEGPFVAVDCSVLPEHLFESELFGHERGAFTGAVGSRVGRLEMAQGGTLFLDEIGNLATSQQAKLLRVIQQRRFQRIGGRETIELDVRLVAATNVDLLAAISAREFRQDLYYRLNEVSIQLPPLRRRREDIEALAGHFITLYAARFQHPAQRLSAEALALLQAYAWPGNVRELKNAMKSAVILAGEEVRPAHIPVEVGGQRRAAVETVGTRPVGSAMRISLDLDLPDEGLDLKKISSEVAQHAERALLESLAREPGITRARLARYCHVDPKTLRTKLQKYGIQLAPPPTKT